MSYAAAMGRIEFECETSRMAPTYGRFIRLMAMEKLVVVVELVNVSIKLINDGTLMITMEEMLQCLPLSLTSHITGLTMVRTIDIIRCHGTVLPSSEKNAMHT